MRKDISSILVGAGLSVFLTAAYIGFLSISCRGGSGDPTGALQGLLDWQAGHMIPATHTPSAESSRIVWEGYTLEIRPGTQEALVLPLDRDVQGHFNVTSFVKKPACNNCIKLENVSFDTTAGIVDLDARLTNPTKLGGYDVRAVLLLDEWGTGRKLLSAHGLTDFWSKDPYHPDPFLNYDREDPNRYFGSSEQHAAHVRIFFPSPGNFKVPFIIDASYPDHPYEPVEMMNISVKGSVHPTGYDLRISLDLLDWKNGVKGVFVDCSALSPYAGLVPFSPPQSQSSSTWTVELKYDPGGPFSWLPEANGEVDLPIVAKDADVNARLYQRIPITVAPDTSPPSWTSQVGIDQVWWGGSTAIISFFPASDPSGPVVYNIYSTSNIPLIPPKKDTVVGWCHYSVEVAPGAVYEFTVTAQDQAGNEADNSVSKSGSCKGVTEIWRKVFSADLDSSPNVRDTNADGIQDVIFGCDDGRVYSLSGTDGSVQWSFQTGAMVKSTPALRDVNNDGIVDVLVGSNDTKIYALNLLFGEPYAFKTYQTSNVVESSPVCADQTGDAIPEVVAGSFDGKLYAFAGGSGTLLISYDTKAAIKSTPSLEDFTGDGHYDVVVASGGIVRAINGATGAVIWSYDFGTGFSLGSPAIGDLTKDGVGDVVLGSGASVYALDVKSKKVIWTKQLEGNFDTSPALGDFTSDGVPDVAISSRYVGVYLLNGKDGALIWKSNDSIYMPTSPAVADMNADSILDVVVGAADYRLRILNGADGYTLYNYMTSSYTAITTVPLVTDVNLDGKVDVVFGTESHEMVAITTNCTMPTSPNLIPWPKFMRTRSNTGNLAHPLT